MDERGFLTSFVEVLHNAIFLPTANCFALLPPLIGMGRSGEESSCSVDYEPEEDVVFLTTQKDYKLIYF